MLGMVFEIKSYPKIKTFLLGGALLFFPISALSVEGYSNIKFGSTTQQLLDANLCDFNEFESSTIYSVPGVITYGCRDFVFYGKKTIAIATFIDGKFQQIGIFVNKNSAIKLVASLWENFGKPSLFTKKEERNIISRRGGSIYQSFDNGTVVIQINIDEITKNESMYLFYSSPEFADKMVPGR